MALKHRCNLSCGENGQISISKQQLDMLGVMYEANEPAAEQTCSAAANLKSMQNSSTLIAQRESLLAYMEIDAIDAVPPTHNL